MKKFIHPNIVSMLGMHDIQITHIAAYVYVHMTVTTCYICIGHCEATSDGAPMMILELMQYGDLKSFLKTNRLS